VAAPGKRDGRTRGYAELGGDVLRAGHVRGIQKVVRGGAVLLPQRGGEAGAFGDRVGEQFRLDEGAEAAADADRAFLGQRGQRTPGRMAVHAEARGQLRLVRQARARRQQAGVDIVRQGLLDLVPYRHGAAAIDRRGVHGPLRFVTIHAMAGFALDV
jgi:hypothetical protein